MSNDSNRFESVKLYFHVAQDEYRDEVARSQRLDEKVGRLLNFVNFLLVGLVALCTTQLTSSFYNGLSNGLRFVSVGLIILLAVCIGIAWFSLIQASKFTAISKINIDDQLTEWAQTLDPITLYLTLGTEYKIAIQASEKQLKSGKEQPIALSIFFLKFSVIVFFVFFTIMFLAVYGEMK